MKMKLQYKIILPISVLILLAVGLCYWSVKDKSRSMLEYQIKDHLDTLTESIASAVETENDLEMRGLDTIACIPVVKNLDKSFRDKTDIIDGIVTDCVATYYDMGYINAQGDSIYYHSDSVRSFSEKKFFREAMKGNVCITNPYYDSDYGENLVMSYGYPVKDDEGNVTGVAFSTIDGYRLCDIISKRLISENTDISIFDRDTGYVIASHNRENVDFESHNYKAALAALKDKNPGFCDVLNEAFLGKTGSTFCLIWNKESIVAYRPISGTNWTVLVQAPYSDFNERANKLAQWLLRVFCIMLASLMVIGLVVIRRSLKPLKKVKNAVTDLASGNADLTKRISNDTRDEIGDVVDGVNSFTEKLHVIMSDVKSSRNDLKGEGKNLSDIADKNSVNVDSIIKNIMDVNNHILNQSSSVEETAGAVNEIASNIVGLEKMIEKQTVQVAEASSAVEQMLGNIVNVNQAVEKMADSFNELDMTAKNGSSKQEDVNDKIRQIELQSETLQDANQAISSIAEQTNLLAMNAAIEAAHAGEAGKGFSVVADEIRKLSETSSNESKTIGEQLRKIQELILDVVEASGESSKAFVAVKDKISETDNFVKNIRNAMAEQTLGSRQISESLGAMNDSAQEVRSASSEMAAGNKAILEEVRNLQEATHEMRVSVTQMKAGAEEVRSSEKSLNEVVCRMDRSIEQISVQIDQFQV